MAAYMEFTDFHPVGPKLNMRRNKDDGAGNHHSKCSKSGADSHDHDQRKGGGSSRHLFKSRKGERESSREHRLGNRGKDRERGRRSISERYQKTSGRKLKEIETEEKAVGNPEPHKGKGTERQKKIQGGEKRESRLQTLVDFTQYENEHLLRRALDKDGRLVYFISPDTLTLTDYILTLKNANFNSNERPEDIYSHMVRAAAHLMSDLHSKGCSIGDFNITNLWVVGGIVKFGNFTPTFDASEVAVRKDYSCLSLLITTVIEIEEEKELERTSRCIEVDNHRSVYVENLNHDVTESQILEVFKLYGVVEKVILHTNERRMSRGYCFIEFNCRESAESALQLNGKTLEISYQPMKVVLRKVDLGSTSSRKVGSYTPSPCLMLKGVFDPKMEPDSSAIEAAVREKCRPIQELRHIFVDKASGSVYLRFKSALAALDAKFMYDDGKEIAAIIMDYPEYEELFPHTKLPMLPSQTRVLLESP